MELSRVDETELLVPLHEGLRENPRWATFLARLRRRTRADRATLLLTAGGSAEIARFGSRGSAAGPADPLDRVEAARLRELRPGRVYAGEELVGMSDPTPAPLRIVRVSEQGGATLWTAISRERGQFGAGEGALLGGLVPHLGVALRTATELARERLRVRLGSAALGQAGVGWLTLDAEARLVELDPLLDGLLAQASARPRAGGERLLPPVSEAARALQQACALFAADPSAPPRLVRLADRPRLDLLVRPLAAILAEGIATPVLLGLARIAPSIGPDAAPPLGMLLGLTRVEARLALALARGRSIVEAGAELGLTEETARNYSKRLYAKTDSRGQAEIVARVLTSVAALA